MAKHKKRETRRSLESLIFEACEVARDCNLSGADLAKFAREFANEMMPHLRDSIMVGLEGCGHLYGTKAECAAVDAANFVIAGPAPSPRHMVCACNRAWVKSEMSITVDAAGKEHGYEDCQ